MMSGERNRESTLQLNELACTYFKKEGFDIKYESITKEGYSGVPRHFEMIVQRGRNEQPVWIRNWNRTIGVNVIIGLDTATADIGLSNPIMIGEKFSDHAKSYSNRRKIMLLTRNKITASLRSY